MITPDSENSHKLAGIWLRCSLASHGFIPAEYWKGNFTAMAEVYLPSSENYVYKRETDGEILGFVSLRGNHIEALFVDPEHQGTGIGQRLLDFAKSKGKELTVTVYLKNEGALKFYNRNGFREVSSSVDEGTGESQMEMIWEK